MKRILKTLALALAAFGLLYGVAASATALQGFQGGTGFSTSSAGTVGQFLQVASTSPYLTYQLAAPSGSATTTINGVTGPTFTITILPTSTGTNAWTVTTSSANLFLNLLQYTSGTNINVSANGVINFVNPGYITTSTISALSPIVYTSSSGQFSCPTCIATNTGNWAGTWQGVNPNNFLASSTTSSSLGVVYTPTTTINGAQGNTFNFTIATTSGNPSITSSTSGGSSTIAFTVPSGGSGNPLTTGNTPTIIAASGTISQTVAYSGASTTYTIPAYATGNVTITAVGAAGGGATTSTGVGGAATGTLSSASSTAGTVYYVNVGGQGTLSTSNPSGGGYNGGGGGGYFSGNAAYGGGGMTQVSATSSFSSNVLVGAGGGGNGSVGGGAAGGLTGTNGSSGTAGGGSGGTQGACASGGNGSAGSNASGGGGGGGCGGGTGGGGSAVGTSGGGGGGASQIGSNLTATSTASTTNTGNGYVVFSFKAQSIISGTNYAGTVTVGFPISTSTLSFNNAGFANGESCGVETNNATNTHWISYNGTSSFTVTFQNQLSANQSFNYWCLGY